MRPIPKALRNLLASQERMKHCALLDKTCQGRIEWHHPWIYAGRQINEWWSIIGACAHHHRKVGSDREIRKGFERATLSLASEEDLAKYPRKDWNAIKIFLNK